MKIKFLLVSFVFIFALLTTPSKTFAAPGSCQWRQGQGCFAVCNLTSESVAPGSVNVCGGLTTASDCNGVSIQCNPPANTNSQNQNNTGNNTGNTTTGANQQNGTLVGDVPTLSGLENIFGNVVGVALGFGGITLFIMMVVGGFRFMTAGGDSGKVQGAQKTLTYSIAGIVFMALSFLLLRFIGAFTNVDLTQFRVFLP